jgi:hypothetical protein
MTCDRGVVVPLANYTLRPVETLSLTVRVPRPVSRVESARRGLLPLTARRGNEVIVTLPLEATDFVKLYYDRPEEAKSAVGDGERPRSRCNASPLRAPTGTKPVRVVGDDEKCR